MRTPSPLSEQTPRPVSRTALAYLTTPSCDPPPALGLRSASVPFSGNRTAPPSMRRTPAPATSSSPLFLSTLLAQRPRPFTVVHSARRPSSPLRCPNELRLYRRGRKSESLNWCSGRQLSHRAFDIRHHSYRYRFDAQGCFRANSWPGLDRAVRILPSSL